jgi:hypothetical protein
VADTAEEAARAATAVGTSLACPYACPSFACLQKPVFARREVSIGATCQDGRAADLAISENPCPHWLCVLLLSNCISRKGCVYRGDGAQNAPPLKTKGFEGTAADSDR